MKRRNLWVAAGLGFAGAVAWASRPPADWSGRVVLITGGSRGLGFQLARELARERCRLILCARDQAELERARDELELSGASVFIKTCDVADKRQVESLIEEATMRFGGIDVLINNAGIIQVGPVESMTLDDFERSMAINFWGTVYPTLSVLPSMLARRRGSIVNITSIGGKVSVPHLLPYTCAKFAAVGFSEGLRVELRGKGVKVTTIVPGLMRTGSFNHALFKGNQELESVWFSAAASLPGISMSAERAARQIVRAAKRGAAEQILSIPANLLARSHGAFPEFTLMNMTAVSSLLPSAGRGSSESRRGMEIRQENPSRLIDGLTALGRKAAERLNEYPFRTT